MKKEPTTTTTIENKIIYFFFIYKILKPVNVEKYAFLFSLQNVATNANLIAQHAYTYIYLNVCMHIHICLNVDMNKNNNNFNILLLQLYVADDNRGENADNKCLFFLVS